MAKRISLREFQESLVARLTSAARGEAARSWLGVETGTVRWLVDLFDSGEVVPLPELTPVPLTRSWFAGIANNHGSNSALLVKRTLGLKTLEDLEPKVEDAADSGARPWSGECYVDNQRQEWTRLRVRKLLADLSFLDVGQ